MAKASSGNVWAMDFVELAMKVFLIQEVCAKAAIQAHGLPRFLCSFSRDSSSLLDSNGPHTAPKTLADEQGAGKIIPGNIPSLRSPQWRKSLKPEEEDNNNNHNRVLANQKLNESIPGHSRGNLKQGLKESIPDHFHESIKQEPNVSKPDHLHENVKQEPNESMPDHSHESFRGFWEQEPTGQPPATHEAALPGVESWWESPP
ncbi:uncharacterized protein PGTG_05358 [Puccinia graminis f. sp. tritici CRL 75-36-700-3]|uniref:Uncharacterized protein n=1 Tax=Puccinia graminis f. sp. tritici (strain CRL 75-36-700-3 / race SCCL) TaxID=418459 RepID=E3K796_PUCGT|nr:uncharacterized protein PGTG_05358 [Puccinia graminis f. sp. tritici CRL 75-36-700-3]EFP80133.2 hypothetical protein PGTG_05358 [Puccinia graminis f. sp. tritici CRL 75-36-700-3]